MEQNNGLMQILATINTYWAVIAFIGGAVFYTLWAYWELQDVKQRVKNLEDDSVKQGALIQSFETKLSSIDAKMDILLKANNLK